MTRKDYEALADAIYNTELTDSQEAARELIAIAIAGVLAHDSERFDRDRFLKAALSPKAVVQSVLRVGLDGKAYVAYQAVADGYGIVAEGSRGFAEQAALAFNA